MVGSEAVVRVDFGEHGRRKTSSPTWASGHLAHTCRRFLRPPQPELIHADGTASDWAGSGTCQGVMVKLCLLVAVPAVPADLRC
jgi:hypothetical protein